METMSTMIDYTTMIVFQKDLIVWKRKGKLEGRYEERGFRRT